jgi:hypothetical protein
LIYKHFAGSDVFCIPQIWTPFDFGRRHGAPKRILKIFKNSLPLQPFWVKLV